MKKKLTTYFCKIKFSTPLISPSGIVVKPKEIIKLARNNEVGGVTSKSISISPRKGHKFPRIVSFKIGYLNSVGLENPGIKLAIKELKLMKRNIRQPIIASIFGSQLADFPFLAKEISKARPDFIELNLSCPNVDDEFGKPFATDPLLTAMAVLEVKKVVKNIPIIAKLTPNTSNLKRVAFEAEKAGADAICAINTLGPGMLINIKKKRLILGHGRGGVSGPAIKPIALRCVNDIYKTVKIPIIGLGGIENGKDALEMIMAGATLIGVGSAIFQQGYKVFELISQEMKEIMKKEKWNSLNQIRGII